MNEMGCIYIATNKYNGRVYVGKTEGTLAARRKGHERDARIGSTFYFHRAIRKYGVDGFDWRVLLEVDNEDLSEVEKFQIKRFRSKPAGTYNLADGGTGGATRRGVEHSEASKEKIRTAHRGKTLTAEHREAIGRSGKGRAVSQELREHLRRLFKGREVSQETKDKIAAAKRGSKLSPAHKAVFHNRGRKHTPETVQRIKDAATGRKLSDDAKKKISESRRAYERAKATLAEAGTTPPAS